MTTLPPKSAYAAAPVDAVVRAGRRLAQVEALSGIGSWEWDIEADRLFWSEQLCHLYGMEPDPAPISLDDFLARVHPDDRDEVVATVRGALEGGGMFETEHRAVHPGGTVRTISGRGHVITDVAGRPIRMLGTGQDITDQRAAEARRAAEERSRAAGEARDEALALIAHDLRSPLAVVVGYIQLLRRQAAGEGSVDPERLNPYLERMDTAARQMTALLDELLTDAAAEDAVEPVERTSADLIPPLRAIAQHHDEVSSEHRVVADLPGDPLMADVNLPKLERAIHNLLGNALKYSPDGGTITLSLRADGDAAHISVADQGIGIPAADLPRIFERFHRGANVAGRTSGLGLGLISVKRAVEAHGGRVSIDSVEGEGTTFTIELPLRA